MIFDKVTDATVSGLNVDGNSSAESAVRLINSKDVLMTAPRLLSPAPVFLQVEGASNESITVDGGDISKAKKGLVLKSDASDRAVRMRS